MKNIDFLPATYRNQAHLKRANLWGYFVLSLFGAVVCLSAAIQFSQRWRANQIRLETETRYQAALVQSQEHQRIMQALAHKQDSADLYAFLGHPWPRTRVLKAIADPLPAEMSLQQVRITYEKLPINDSLAPHAVVDNKTTGSEQNSTREDLERLRKETASKVAVVHILGETSDSTQVHEYAFALSKLPLFASMKLEGVEHHGGERQFTASFRLKAVLKPGLGARAEMESGELSSNAEKNAALGEQQRIVFARTGEGTP